MGPGITAPEGGGAGQPSAASDCTGTGRNYRWDGALAAAPGDRRPWERAVRGDQAWSRPTVGGITASSEFWCWNQNVLDRLACRESRCRHPPRVIFERHLWCAIFDRWAWSSSATARLPAYWPWSWPRFCAAGGLRCWQNRPRQRRWTRSPARRQNWQRAPI